MGDAAHIRMLRHGKQIHEIFAIFLNSKVKVKVKFTLKTGHKVPEVE
jgi:hypothetical protein